MWRGLLVVALGLAACEQDTALPIEADCNPLGASGCLTPWPSSALGTDGFSPAMPISVELEAQIDPATLGRPDATVLLDLTTGARVPHTAMLEARPDAVEAIRLVPTVALASGHHYAVAIGRAVLDVDGEELASPPGFTALLDGRYTDHELLEALRPRFAETLDALTAAGIDPDDLVVAWDFAIR